MVVSAEESSGSADPLNLDNNVGRALSLAPDAALWSLAVELSGIADRSSPDNISTLESSIPASDNAGPWSPGNKPGQPSLGGALLGISDRLILDSNAAQEWWTPVVGNAGRSIPDSSLVRQLSSVGALLDI